MPTQLFLIFQVVLDAQKCNWKMVFLAGNKGGEQIE
jgi:hypothetical protein